MTKRRDSAYYEGRLKKDHPGIYANLRSGKFKSVREAAIAAGLRREPSPLQALKGAWKRASKSEHGEFIKWLRDRRYLVKKGSKIAGGSPRLVDTGGYLTEQTITELKAIISRRRIPPAQICVELGRSRHDYRWRRAFERQDPVPPVFLAKLPAWLAKNRT